MPVSGVLSRLAQVPLSSLLLGAPFARRVNSAQCISWQCRLPSRSSSQQVAFFNDDDGWDRKTFAKVFLSQPSSSLFYPFGWGGASAEIQKAMGSGKKTASKGTKLTRKHETRDRWGC